MKDSVKEYLKECKKMGFIVNEEHETVRDPMEVFRKTTPEKPVFVDLTIKDIDFNENSETYNQSFDAWRGVVACEGTRIMTASRADEIDVLFGTDKTEKALFRGLGVGENLRDSKYPPFNFTNELKILDRENFFVNDIVPATNELMKMYSDSRDKISCKIYASVYPEYETPSFIQTLYMPPEEKRKLNFKMKDAVIKAVMNPIVSHTYEVKGIETFEEAQKWMIKNHPESAIGFSFITPAEQVHLSFSFDTSERNGWLGTREQREVYVKALGRELGVEVGKFDYTEVDRIKAEKEKNHKNFNAMER